MIKYENVSFCNLDCIRIFNDVAEIVVPISLGIRILKYNLLCKNNTLKNFNEQIDNKSINKWQSFGGHRLWVAPEIFPNTYEIDGAPLQKYEITSQGLMLTQKMDAVSKICKQVTIELDDKTANVVIKHQLRNMNDHSVDVAAWGITVLNGGGFCAIKQPKLFDALLPNRSISLWPYSPMNDDRVYWGKDVITLSGKSNINPFKLGMFSCDGKAIYVNDNQVFSKTFGCDNSKQYLDFNCNFESYTVDGMLECESLSAVNHLEVGESFIHTETWDLKGIDKRIDARDEDSILQLLK